MCYELKASVGYGYDEHEEGVGCGGVLTLINLRLFKNAMQSVSLSNNRFRWVILTGMSGGDIGLTHIYAPNESMEQCFLWRSIGKDLPQPCRWLLLCDFNMMEGWTNKSHHVITMITHRAVLSLKS